MALVRRRDGKAVAAAVAKELASRRPRINSWAVVQPRGQFLDEEDVQTLLALGARNTVRKTFNGVDSAQPNLVRGDILSLLEREFVVNVGVNRSWGGSSYGLLAVVEYPHFLEWAEGQGLEFPCTAAQFSNRAWAYAQGDEGVHEALMIRGVGWGWKNNL